MNKKIEHSSERRFGREPVALPEAKLFQWFDQNRTFEWVSDMLRRKYQIHLSDQTLKDRFSTMGLTFTTEYESQKSTLKRSIVNAFVPGQSTRILAAKFGISDRRVRAILSERKIVIRKKGVINSNLKDIDLKAIRKICTHSPTSFADIQNLVAQGGEQMHPDTLKRKLRAGGFGVSKGVVYSISALHVAIYDTVNGNTNESISEIAARMGIARSDVLTHARKTEGVNQFDVIPSISTTKYFQLFGVFIKLQEYDHQSSKYIRNFFSEKFNIPEDQVQRLIKKFEHSDLLKKFRHLHKKARNIHYTMTKVEAAEFRELKTKLNL